MRETGEQQENILEVRDLQLAFLGVNGRVEALRGVNLAVAAGEIVALVGESGSGKTALCRAALGLHANHAVIEHGGIWACGARYLDLDREGLVRAARTRRIDGVPGSDVRL